MPMTHATEPVTIGGSTLSSAGLPAALMMKPMMMLKMPVAMMPACSVAITWSGAGTPNFTSTPIALAMPR